MNKSLTPMEKKLMTRSKQVSIIHGDFAATPSAIHSVLPSDLREWIDARELLASIYEAAQTFCWTTRSTDNVNGKSNGYPFVLLSVLTYCYATATLATAEVERRITIDAALGLLCSKSRIDRRTLQLFRGHYSELLKCCFAH